MALTDEQRERIRAYARALQGDPNAAPTQPLPAPSVPPQPGGPTQPLRTPPPDEPETPAPGETPGNGNDNGKKPRAVARAFVRHLGKWDSHLGGSIPTPGRIGWLIFALVFLLFAVVPFNGHTRLQLIWYALTGAATLPGGTGTPGQSATQAQAAINAVGSGFASGLGVPPGAGGAIGSGFASGLGVPVFIPRQLGL